MDRSCASRHRIVRLTRLSMVCLVGWLGASVQVVAQKQSHQAEAAAPTRSVVDVERKRLDVEFQRLKLEELRLSREEKLLNAPAERALENDDNDELKMFGAGVAAVASFWFAGYRWEQQRKNEARLKAAELLFAASSPKERLTRATILAVLLPDDLKLLGRLQLFWESEPKSSPGMDSSSLPT